MSDEIKKLLDDRIRADILRLGNLEIGSEEKEAAVDDLVKLYKLRIEETKNEMDFEEKQQTRIAETSANEEVEKNKQAQLTEAVKDRYFRVGLAAAEIVLPLMFYATWMKRGFKFEETGAYTSTTFKGLINRFKPTKK